MTLAFGHVANKFTSCAPCGVMTNFRGAERAANWSQAEGGTSAYVCVNPRASSAAITSSKLHMRRVERLLRLKMSTSCVDSGSQ
jgi:hypothetical protein